MSDKEFIITEFDKGIGPSPHLGYGDMRNLDIFSVPGVAFLNNKLTKRSSSLIAALPNWIVRDPVNVGSLVAIAQNAVVYASKDTGATWYQFGGSHTGTGQGLIIRWGYLFVATTSGIDVFGPLSGAGSWTTNWKTIDSDNSFHPMLASKNDGLIYGGAGKYIFSIEQIGSFAPGNAGTYTFTQQALDLPDGYVIKCLEELGNNLMIGTHASAGYQYLKVADIFPWDRASPSFGQPLSLNVNGVHAMLTINNILYVLAGLEGKIFSSNGVQSAMLGQIPASITSTGSSSTRFLLPSPGAFVNYKERPMFGYNSAVGVWSISPTRAGNILNLEHTISTGDVTTAVVSALLPLSQDELLVGWSSGSGGTFGIDKTDNTLRTSGYAGYFDSAFYRVGTYHNKVSFREIEMEFDKPLVVGQGVELRYRTALNADMVLIGTYTHSTASTTQIGGVISHVAVPGIPKTDYVQIRASLAPGSSDTNASPRIKHLILR